MVEFRGLRKTFGDRAILRGLDLKVESGEFVAVVGPSGCGKSTLLRLLAGLENADAGEILIDGQAVSQLGPAARDVGLVFQSYALYPHLSVRANIAFPLKMRRMEARLIDERLRETAQMLDLTDLLDRKPAQLSGGQKQRVAMARAIVKRPRVLLFDEPLSNLDAQLRTRVRSEIAQLHRRLRSTVIYVTHDQVEAMTLADRVAVLQGGRLEQFAAPLELYESPKTSFVASFVGTPPMNLLALEEAGECAAPPRAASVGFRPERTRWSREVHAHAGFEIPAQITLLERLGAATHVHALAGRTPVTFLAHKEGLSLGDTIRLSVNANDLYFFDADGARL